MTILVGVRCRDGIVIGADSAATFSAGQLRTIEQPVKKISVIADRIIVAGTGEIGLNQRFCNVVSKAWTDKALRGNNIDVGRILAKTAIEDFASTQAGKGTYGALVALPVGNRLELIEFASTNLQPELKTDDLWYVSMGSGQTIADPCLGFIRQAFWSDGMPSVEDGVFAVVWTLAQAIHLNPGGVNGPMHVALLTNGVKGEPVARILEQGEIAEHEANVHGAIEHLRQYRRKVKETAATEIPKPPQAP